MGDKSKKKSWKSKLATGAGYAATGASWLGLLALGVLTGTDLSMAHDGGSNKKKKKAISKDAHVKAIVEKNQQEERQKKSLEEQQKEELETIHKHAENNIDSEAGKAVICGTEALIKQKPTEIQEDEKQKAESKQQGQPGDDNYALICKASDSAQISKNIFKWQDDMTAAGKPQKMVIITGVDDPNQVLDEVNKTEKISGANLLFNKPKNELDDKTKLKLKQTNDVIDVKRDAENNSKAIKELEIDTIHTEQENGEPTEKTNLFDSLLKVIKLGDVPKNITESAKQLWEKMKPEDRTDALGHLMSTTSIGENDLKKIKEHGITINEEDLNTAETKKIIESSTKGFVESKDRYTSVKKTVESKNNFKNLEDNFEKTGPTAKNIKELREATQTLKELTEASDDMEGKINTINTIGTTEGETPTLKEKALGVVNKLKDSFKNIQMPKMDDLKAQLQKYKKAEVVIENTSATKIKKAFKAYKQRQKSQTETKSAAKIQKVFRGFSGRAKAKAEKEQVALNKKKEQAAPIMQKTVRGFLARQAKKVKEESAAKIQKVFRGVLGKAKEKAEKLKIDVKESIKKFDELTKSRTNKVRTTPATTDDIVPKSAPSRSKLKPTPGNNRPRRMSVTDVDVVKRSEPQSSKSLTKSLRKFSENLSQKNIKKVEDTAAPTTPPTPTFFGGITSSDAYKNIAEHASTFMASCVNKVTQYIQGAKDNKQSTDQSPVAANQSANTSSFKRK